MEGGRDWWQQIEEAVRAVEYLLLVVTAASLRSDYVRKEWRFARQEGRCVIPVLADSSLIGSDIFKALPGWMQRAYFVDADDPEQWVRLLEMLKRPCEARRVPFMGGDRPEGYIERTKEMEDLIGHLLRGETHEPVAITGALQGAGGFGKTTLARALCHDPRIEEAFDDGILWVTLGEQPGPLMGRIVDLIVAMTGGPRPTFDQEQTAMAELGKTLGEQRVLLVIDDVWDAAHLTPFLQGGRHCARLMTTRNRSTVPPSATTVSVDAMQLDEAVALLGAGLPEGDTAALRRLATRLGEWPLLLKLVNGQLRERVITLDEPLAEAINRIAHSLDRRGITAFDVKYAQQRDQAVAETLGASLALLDKHERQRFAELAVFPQDALIPLVAVETLWGSTAGLDELDSEDLVRKLFRFSLLFDLNLAQRRLQLHDVVRAYLSPTNEAPRRAVHGALVEAYRAKCDGRWAQLADDDYVFTKLPTHLSEAGQREELRTLILDYPWLAAKLRATDVQALISDGDLLPQDEDIRLLQQALRLSAHVLAKQPDQLPSQLTGRLRGVVRPTLSSLLRQIEENAPRPWLSPQTPSLTRTGGPLIRTLEGHMGSVSAVVVLADGRRALSGSGDQTLRLWDLETGTLLNTLKGHSDLIRAVVAATDSGRALSGSDDGTLKLWDLGAGTLVCTLEGHDYSVTAVALLTDGRRALSGSSDNTVKLWDLETCTVTRTLEGHVGPVTAVAVLKDGRRALSGSCDGTLKLWDLETCAVLRTLEGHEDWVTTLALLPDGRQAVSGSHDKTLKLWDLETGALLRTLRGHTDWVVAAASLADGRRAVSGSNDQTLKLWDLETGALLGTLEGHTAWVTTVAVVPDGRRAVSGSNDKTLKLWDLEAATVIRSPDGHSGPVYAVAVLKDGRQALSGSWDRTLKLWDLVTGALIRTLEGHSNAVYAVAVLPDGRWALSGSSDRTLKLWDLETGGSIRTLEGHWGPVMAAALLDDQRALSGSDDRTLKLWDLETGAVIRTLEGHVGAVYAVAVLDEDLGALSGSKDRTLKVWNLKTGTLIRTHRGHWGPVNTVAVMPDGRQALSGSDDGTLMVWNMEIGNLLRTLRGHEAWVAAVAGLAHGRQALSGSYDRTLKLWDLETGRCLTTFAADAPVSCVAAAGSHLFIAGDWSGAVHILRLIE